MRFNVVGADPETGQALEMVVDATTVEEAASVARRRCVDVMSVSPAEAAKVAAPPVVRRRRSVSARPTANVRPGKGLRKFVGFVLVVALVLGPFMPTVALVVGGSLVVALGSFVLLPASRGRLRTLLGIWPDRPVRGVIRFGLLGLYGLLLVGAAIGTPHVREGAKREREKRTALETEAAELRVKRTRDVREILDQARTALEEGDLVRGESLAREAADVKNAHNHADAAALVRRIDRSADGDYFLEVLTRLPDAEFDSFRNGGSATLSTELGFAVLEDRALGVARGVVERAEVERDRLASERAEQLEEKRNREARVKQRRAKAEAATKVPDYRVVRTTKSSNIKLSLDVQLDKPASEEELRAIAQRLHREHDGTNYERTFICYYLPDTPIDGAGAWATTHFNPELEVDIHGPTREQLADWAAEAPRDDDSTVGRWINPAPYVGGTLTLARHASGLTMTTEYVDGSRRVESLVEKTVRGEKRFVVEDNDFGEYYVLRSNGTLRVCDQEGTISTLRVRR